jgi:hypothetical protein
VSRRGQGAWNGLGNSSQGNQGWTSTAGSKPLAVGAAFLLWVVPPRSSSEGSGRELAAGVHPELSKELRWLPEATNLNSQKGVEV